MPTFRSTTTAELIRQTAERLGDIDLLPLHLDATGLLRPLPGSAAPHWGPASLEPRDPTGELRPPRRSRV